MQQVESSACVNGIQCHEHVTWKADGCATTSCSYGTPCAIACVSSAMIRSLNPAPDSMSVRSSGTYCTRVDSESAAFPPLVWENRQQRGLCLWIDAFWPGDKASARCCIASSDAVSSAIARLLANWRDVRRRVAGSYPHGPANCTQWISSASSTAAGGFMGFHVLPVCCWSLLVLHMELRCCQMRALEGKHASHRNFYPIILPNFVSDDYDLMK